MAFVAPTPLLSHRTSAAAPAHTSPRRRVAHAVLETPASNPYLIKVCEGTARDFLTRRAVHNVLYYYTELRDTATKQWLSNHEDFLRLEAQDLFHDGESYIKRMLLAPPVHGVLTQRHAHRAALSRKFSFTIRPGTVARSILASRAHLAHEWEADLRCVDAGNAELQRAALERLVEPDERVRASRRNIVYDSAGFGDTNSPMREANFKKLGVLVTQHAIMRLIAYLRDTSNHDYMWLMSFVARYGPLDDGDHFISQLLRQPAEARTNPAKVIDPRSLAADVMDLRSTIATEWVGLMKRIPEEQLDMTRALLERAVDIDVSKRLDDNM